MDDDDEEIPTITISSPPHFLQTMDTVDDIDEDEAFINELMALHPNDEDIVVEDIEDTPATLETNEADGVRKKCLFLGVFSPLA